MVLYPLSLPASHITAIAIYSCGIWVGNKNLKRAAYEKIKGPPAVLGLSTLRVQNLEKDTFILKITGTVLKDHRKNKQG